MPARPRLPNVRTAMTAETPLPARAAPWDGFAPGRRQDHRELVRHVRARFAAALRRDQTG